jgi:hypothetical protein
MGRVRLSNIVNFQYASTAYPGFVGDSFTITPNYSLLNYSLVSAKINGIMRNSINTNFGSLFGVVTIASDSLQVPLPDSFAVVSMPAFALGSQTPSFNLNFSPFATEYCPGECVVVTEGAINCSIFAVSGAFTSGIAQTINGVLFYEFIFETPKALSF